MADLIIQPGSADDSPLSVFIMGPTATGKTDLAMALYDEIPSDLISVDSALVYRGMDIGTAKPDTDTLARYPHALIDIIEPDQVYSAGQFRDDALDLMAQSASKRRIPVLVGGTMLYFNALQKGIADMPVVDSATRQAVAREAEEQGLQALHDRLREVDPVSAKRIHPNDPQRIKRALELYEYTGKTLTHFWQKQSQESALNNVPFARIKIALMPPDDRRELRVRIAQRFDQMLRNGFLEEVEALYRRGDLDVEMPSIRAVGYRQAWPYIRGEIDFDEMREKAIIATAQLAKRQMTWLRKEQNCNFIDPFSINRQKVLKSLKILLS